MLYEALDAIISIAKNGGQFLFVGTKRSASELIAQAATNCGQYYVNHRWLGGMLTNWETVSKSIKKLKNLEERIESGEINNLTKKERLNIERQKEKLDLTLGGIKNMNGIPDAIFIIDTNKESIAVLEANNLNIPVIAICDSNSNPSGVDFPIPGNDDALRAISLYCDLVAASVLKGLESNLELNGVDIGASETLNEEKVLVNSEMQTEDVLNVTNDLNKT
jgi:small subunit ribosomal protein S2